MARSGANPRPFRIHYLFRNLSWLRPRPAVVRALHKKDALIVATQWQPDDAVAFVDNGTGIPHAVVAVIRDDLFVRDTGFQRFFDQYFGFFIREISRLPAASANAAAFFVAIRPQLIRGSALRMSAAPLLITLSVLEMVQQLSWARI